MFKKTIEANTINAIRIAIDRDRRNSNGSATKPTIPKTTTLANGDIHIV
ncbi:MAG: hypothetical protein GY845_14100 [Planctomycetes bacterium]|nr:hypothetical protein [Planctomycetota bacterium]